MEFTSYLPAQIIYRLYRNRREVNNTLDSADEPSKSQFFRLFTLGYLDAFITVPIAITGLAGNIIVTGSFFSFYQGWTIIHSDWELELFPKSMWSKITWNVFSVYWDKWIIPFWALVFFSLFGLTPEARKGYRRLYYYLGRPFGVRQAESMTESLPEMFGNGGEANRTVTSNVSSRYGFSILTARIHFLIKSKCSTQADVLP